MDPTLLFDYPRFMGNPIQNFIANSKEEMFEYINTYCNFKNLYISVYKFDDVTNKHSAFLDKALFDFDKNKEEPESLKFKDDMWTLHEDLMKDKYLHIIDYSGGGFHTIPFLEPKDSYLNKADALFNMQDYYENKLNIKADPHIKGDLKRIFRIPNTYNFNKGRMCVNIHEDSLLRGSLEDLNKYASNPHKIEFFGKYLINMDQFDIKRTYASVDIKINLVPHLEDNYPDALKDIYDKSPDCVKQLINKKHLDNRERYFLMLFLKESLIKGRLPAFEDLLGLMHEILDEEKWNHFSVDEHMKPLTTIMERNYYIPTCEKIKYEIKCCPHAASCGRRHPRYD